MENGTFDFRSLLDVILNANNKSPSILADMYLCKDDAVIYRWKRNELVPKNDDIAKIVDFASKESTGVQRIAIRNEVEGLVLNSSLRRDIKEVILNSEDFGEFLLEAFSASICNPQSISTVKKTGSVEGYSLKDNTTDEDSTQNLNGKYTGTLKFELDVDGGSGKQALEAEGHVGLMKRIKTNTIKRYILSGKTILSVLAFGIISSIVIFQLASSGQSSKTRTVLRGAPVLISTPVPAQTPLVTPVPVQAQAPEPTPVPPVKKTGNQGGKAPGQTEKKDTGNAGTINESASGKGGVVINVVRSEDVTAVAGDGNAIDSNGFFQASTTQPVHTPSVTPAASRAVDAGGKESGN